MSTSFLTAKQVSKTFTKVRQRTPESAYASAVAKSGFTKAEFSEYCIRAGIGTLNTFYCRVYYWHELNATLKEIENVLSDFWEPEEFHEAADEIVYTRELLSIKLRNSLYGEYVKKAKPEPSITSSHQFWRIKDGGFTSRTISSKMHTRRLVLSLLHKYLKRQQQELEDALFQAALILEHYPEDIRKDYNKLIQHD